MGKNRQKHKQERKRRHKRQMEEGTRQPREKVKKTKEWKMPTRAIVRKRVKLSELDRDDVRAVLEAVKNLDMRP